VGVALPAALWAKRRSCALGVCRRWWVAMSFARGLHAFSDESTGSSVVVGEKYVVVEEGGGWTKIQTQVSE
jgi:hypothetical protein